MGNSPQSVTNSSLLGRLRCAPTDQAAWQEFVARYGPKIYLWCRQWQLQAADAEDVTQTVLAKLAVRMNNFVYDPDKSFHGWLRTLVIHALSDFLAARRERDRSSGDPLIWQELESVAAREDLLGRLEEEFDRELLEEAKARVQLRVGERKWQAFSLTAFEGLSGADAAQRLQMNIVTVFSAKSKVLKLLQDEVRKLQSPDGGGGKNPLLDCVRPESSSNDSSPSV
jgi:RNA polymerase sigma-70 factor (ECF subfamily)